MPTVIEIANKLAESFVQAQNKKLAAKDLIFEINSLSYADSKQPIEYSLKVVMIELIHELISGKRTLQSKNGKPVPVTSNDNRSFTVMKDSILKRLNTNTRAA